MEHTLEPRTRTPADEIQRSSPPLALLGRLLLSSIFLWTVWSDVVQWRAMTNYMVDHGMPMPHFLLAGADLCKLVGGILLLLGLRARFGALLLLAFLIPATVIFHDFWNAGPEAYQGVLIQFQKNVAIMGGLLLVIAHGPGRWSVSRD